MDRNRRVLLDEISELTGGFAFKSKQYVDRGHFVLRTVNIRDDSSITRDGAVFISEDDARNFMRFTLKEHDTLFVMVAATLGKIGYVRKRDLPALLNQNMWVIRAKPGQVDPVYLHYQFRELSKIPLAWVSGSARSFLRRNDVRTLKFNLPDQRTQVLIGELLKALDDKIELNRRMNETLEAMARAIFKDWFVDFGPTRAKMEGRAPYLAPDIWSLFPDRLDDDGKPEGWITRRVGDLAELRGGKQLEKERIAPFGTIPVFGGAGLMGFTDEHNADGFVISVGRVGAYCGQFFSHRGKAWINNNASVIRPFEWVSGEWLFQVLRHANIEVIKKGAAQPFVSNTDLANMLIIWPGENIIYHYANVVVPLMLKMDQNGAESSILINNRDLLLPKLMSGEVRVKDAEKAAEAVI